MESHQSHLYIKDILTGWTRYAGEHGVDARCRCFGHYITLIAVIELPVDVGVRLEIAHVDRSCFDREGADGDREHTTRWCTIAG